MKGNPAYKLARRLADIYCLTSTCQVNLEGTINNMIQDGINIIKIESYLTDIYDNYSEIFQTSKPESSPEIPS